MHDMRLLAVFGARPKAVKMAPAVPGLADDPRFESQLCLTAQHRQMLDQVIDLFGILPDFDLNVMAPGEDLHGVTTAIANGLKPIVETASSNVVLVHGDTPTPLPRTQASSRALIFVGPVEAGLRARNLYSLWPEEDDRRATNTLPALHFAPTEASREALRGENVQERRSS